MSIPSFFFLSQLFFLLPPSSFSSPPPLSLLSREQWVRLPFLGPFSHRISSYLRKNGYKTAFYSILKVEHLSSLKDRIPPHKQSGIYRALCNAPSCNAIYIGQTGRTLQTRIAEHRSAFSKKKNADSAIADHCLSSQHDFSHIEFKLIHRATKGRLLNHLEMVETVAISKNSEYTALNDLLFVYVNPFISFTFGQ